MKSIISMVLAMCMVISMLPAMALTAFAAPTWYAEFLSENTKYSNYRGTVKDIDGDGAEELLLLENAYDSFDQSHNFEVWSNRDSTPACIMKVTLYGYSSPEIVFAVVDGIKYFVTYHSSTGTVGTTYTWDFYDPADLSEKQFVMSYFSTPTIDGAEISDQRFYLIRSAVCAGEVLLSGDIYGDNVSELISHDDSDIGDTEVTVLRSGTCGTGVQWVVTSDGLLSITGSGNMKDYTQSSGTPWNGSLCTSISKIVIEEGVTSIGNRAFEGLIFVTDVDIPSSVSRIGEYAFASCEHLTGIEIPYGVTEIGSYAFRGCVRLSDVSIPSTVTTISKGMFETCSFISRIVIPNSVTTIGQYAFQNCRTLHDIALPNGVTTVGDSAFTGCTNLESFVIPDGMTSIPGWMFSSCNALKTVSIPSNITSVERSAFIGCEALTDVYFSGSREQWDTLVSSGVAGGNDPLINAPHIFCDGEEPDCIAYGVCGDDLSWELDKNCVLTISGTGEMYDYQVGTAPWYPYWEQIWEVNMEPGITHIGTSAFQDCNYIQTFSLPEGITDIGERAFYACWSAEEISIPQSVTSIGAHAFEACGNLLRADIPEGVTAIEEHTFSDCSNLTAVSFPESLSTIAQAAFSGCINLMEVTIPAMVTEIQDSVFYRCEKLQSVTLQEGTKYVGEYAFYDCTALKTVRLPSSTCGVEYQAFYNCTNITDVYYGGVREEWDRMVDLRVIEPGNDRLINAPYLHCSGTQLLAYTENPYMMVSVGNNIQFLCTLMADGFSASDWEPIRTVDNPDVLSIKGCQQQEDGSYILTFRGEASGSCNVTLTDPQSGAYVYFKVTVNDTDAVPYVCTFDEVPHFYPDIICDRDTLTNIYNCSGLYVTDFPYAHEFVKQNGKYMLTFTVYNSKAMYGSVDVFDAQGRWIGSQRIDKHSDPEGLWDVAKDTFWLIDDTLSGDMLSFTANSFSAKTEIEIEVPEGGFFTISNNFAESFGTFLYNAVDYFMLAAKATTSIVYSAKQLEEIQEKVVKRIFENPVANELFYNAFAEVTQKCSARLAIESYGDMVEALMGYSFDFIGDLGIDFWGIVDSVISATTEFGTDVFVGLTSGTYIGIALKGMFEVSKGVNLFCQTMAIKYSDDNRYVLLYTPGGGQSNTVYGITVNADEGVIPSDAVLRTFRVSTEDTASYTVHGDDIQVVKNEQYDICFVKGGEEVQPNGTVQVKIALSDRFGTENVHVLHQQEDGSWVLLESTVSNGVITFEVNHFSLFAVVELAESETEPSDPTDPSEPIDPTDPTDPTEPSDPSEPAEPAGEGVIRLSGANRYATGFAVADQLKENLGVESFEAVVVAYGQNFPDALTGSYLAAVKNAPILLTEKSVDHTVAAYIDENLVSGGTVYILGGAAAVSESFENALRSRGFAVKRLKGAGRYETNLAILKEAGVNTTDEVLIATGKNYADSLSASATGLPMLLVDKELSEAQKAFLETTSGKFVIIGGTGAVSADVEAELDAMGDVTRVKGANRYGTSVEIAKRYFTDPESAVLAYAQGFPDGLCGGPLALSMDAPLILTSNDSFAAADDYVAGISSGAVTGGTSRISDDTVRAIFDLSPDTPVVKP